MKQKQFTPINPTYVEQLCKKYNLVEGHFDSEIVNLSDDYVLTEFKSFGLNEESANYYPIVSFYKTKTGVRCVLNEEPYIDCSYDKEDEIHYIEPGNSMHKVQSVERFEKYLVKSIDDFKSIIDEYDRKYSNERKS